MGAPGAGELLEREETLAHVDALMDAARDGSGRLLLLEGPPGIGKTAVLRASAGRATDAGMTVLRATAGELEMDLAYGVVRQLFAALGSEARTDAELWEGAAALARPVVDPGAPLPAGRVDQFAVLHGLFWLCASVAQRSALALVVDDAHWADRSSLRWLVYLARRVGDLPVAVVVARRPPAGADAQDVLASLVTEPAATTLTLSPLSERGSATLVRRAVGPELPEEVCRSCHAATGGNPFYLAELVAAGGETLLHTGSDRFEAQAPQRVVRSVLARVAALGPDAIALARAVAVLGSRAQLRQAAALAELDPAIADALADQLAGSGILRAQRPLEFVHPIVRAAVYGELPDGARSALHRRAARLLHDDGSDPAEVAVMLLAAEPYGDPWVTARLREAAQAVRGRGDPGVAATYLARALEETSDATERGDVLFDLGAAERQLMAPNAAEHLRDALRCARDPRRRAEIAAELMPMLVQPQRLAEAHEVLDEVLPEALEHAPELAAQLEGSRVGLQSFHLAAPPDTDASYRLLERLDPLELPARLLRGVLATEAMVRGHPVSEIWELLDSALTDSRTRIAQAADLPILFIATITATICERFDLTEPLYAEVLEESQRRGSAFAAGAVWACRSQLYFRLGRVRSAEADARAAVDALGSMGLGSPPAQLVDALIERGEIDEALAVLDRTGWAADIPPSLFSILFLSRRIRLRVAAGELDSAVADVALAERWTTDAGMQHAVTLPWRADGALACLAAGDTRRARSLADEQLRMARAFGAAGVLGVALRTSGMVVGGARGSALLAEAVEVLAGTPMRLEHAKALAALGAAQRRAGERVKARTTLSEALDLADVCGATALASEARAELRVAGARPRRARIHGRDSLTATELRTVTLAAQGMSNNQIAQALFVTAKTVERHLTNAYAKLGIGSRRELAAALGNPAGGRFERQREALAPGH
jgi:DNA-binding CsgD family transcriptional regulator